jgi:tetratricopeptide (TPR) repeat protein
MRAMPQAALMLVVLLGGAPAPPSDTQALARARDAYNEEHYDTAIEHARTALASPTLADAARLVIARAHLERYRQSAEPSDLTHARDALRAIDASRLQPREQAELLVGLGEWLFFAERFGAAAELFSNALARLDPRLPTATRARVLDWWASAMDRHAQRSPVRRETLYNDMLERLEEELRQDPGSSAANYWAIVASRGFGDLDRAWQAAMAAWVRAGLAADRGASLRADVDRFVLTTIIPERAKTATSPGAPGERQVAADAMVSEWERFKSEWDGGD